MRKILFFILLMIINKTSNSQVWENLSSVNQQTIGGYAGNDINLSCSDNLGNVYMVFNYAISKWDGKKWTDLPLHITLPKVPYQGVTNMTDLKCDSKGNVYLLHNNIVYKWNGKVWTILETASSTIYKASSYNNASTINVDTSQNVYVTYSNSTSSVTNYQPSFLKWNGSTWSKIIDPNSALTNLEVSNMVCNLRNNKLICTFKNSTTNNYGFYEFTNNTWNLVTIYPYTTANNYHTSLVKSIKFDVNNNIYAIVGKSNTSNTIVCVSTYKNGSWIDLYDNTKPQAYNNIYVDQFEVLDSSNIFMIGKNNNNIIVSANWNGSYIDTANMMSNYFNTYYNKDFKTIAKDRYNQIMIAGTRYTDQFAFPYLWNGTSWQKASNYQPVYSCIIGTDMYNNIYASDNNLSEERGDLRTYGKFDGTQWKTIANHPGTFTYFGSITVDDSGSIYASSKYFNSVTYETRPCIYLLKKNTSNWMILDSNTTDLSFSEIVDIKFDKIKNLVALVKRQQAQWGNQDSIMVYKWNMITKHWITTGNKPFRATLGGSLENTHFISGFDGNLYVGNVLNNTTSEVFSTISTTCKFAKWDGSNWTEVAGGDGFVKAVDSSGIMYKTYYSPIGGSYPDTNSIQRFVNNKWVKVGTGAAGIRAVGTVSHILARTQNNIVIYAYNNSSFTLKHWNGTKWSDTLLANNQISSVINAHPIYNFYYDKKNNLYAYNAVYGFGNAKNAMCIARFSFSNPYCTISGRFKTSIGKPVNNVTLAINGTSVFNTDVIDTNYHYNKFGNGNNVILRPTKNNDITKANGLNATDVLFVQRHILGSPKLNSAYKIIAADVSGDKLVNATDLLRIKRLILGTDTTFTKGTGATKVDRLWEFVDSAYTFLDTTNPFPFKDSISFTNLTSNKINQTFIGVKLGDVNYDWNPAVAKGIEAKPVELVYHVISTKEKSNQTDFSGTNLRNDEIRIPITVSNFKELVAMQYTFHFDNSKYEFVNLEGFKNLQGFEYNTSQANTNGNISMLWIDKNAVERTLEDGTELFTLVLRSTVANRLSTDLTLTSDITEVAAWDKDYNQHNIVLTKQQKLQTTNIEQWAIYPNPTKGLVNLYVETLVGKGNIVITDVYGKQVKTQPLGLGTNTIDIANLGKGIYFVSVITHEGKTTKKLVVE